MAKHNAANARIKREYFTYLKEAQRRDEGSIDAVAKALARVQYLARELPQTLKAWPWFETLRTLRLRFREDRLGLTAGSLTFTTLIALVPLFTVMLAVFGGLVRLAHNGVVHESGAPVYTMTPDQVAGLRARLRGGTESFVATLRAPGGAS